VLCIPFAFCTIDDKELSERDEDDHEKSSSSKRTKGGSNSNYPNSPHNRSGMPQFPMFPGYFHPYVGGAGTSNVGSLGFPPSMMYPPGSSTRNKQQPQSSSDSNDDNDKNQSPSSKHRGKKSKETEQDANDEDVKGETAPSSPPNGSPGGHLVPHPMMFPPYHPMMSMMMSGMPWMMPNGVYSPHHASTSRGVPLSLQCDTENLSDYQILVRQQLEFFEANVEDVESNTQGRKKPVVNGQVGIRCRHCANLPLRARGRGAVYYPAKLSGVYQAAQNMAASHLCQACQTIPIAIKEDLLKLRQRKDNASGGKVYWADSAKAQSVIEVDDVLRFENSESS